MNQVHIIVIALTSFLLGGCATHNERKSVDLTHSHDRYPVLNKSYEVGGIFKTQTPLFIGENDPPGYVLMKPGGTMPFIDDYLANADVYRKQRYYRDLLGVVDIGTTLTVFQLMFYEGHGSASPYTDANAIINDGIYKDKVVCLIFISDKLFGTPVGILSIPSSEYLELVPEE